MAYKSRMIDYLLMNNDNYPRNNDPRAAETAGRGDNMPFTVKLYRHFDVKLSKRGVPNSRSC
jgi:hypothetical protein